MQVESCCPFYLLIRKPYVIHGLKRRTSTNRHGNTLSQRMEQHRLCGDATEGQRTVNGCGC